MRKSKANLEAPRSGFFFAPGAVESSKARRQWAPIVREWAICIAIAVLTGTVTAFFNSRF
ncbi:hypothetical protein [Diaphorobacter caeni]|uniref:hypothetical protein n=1 Tax=Diaphorobacter caeni TaxID=2784387 RepID=UPI0018906EAD|nr:hypothetical protein [Diaphorobacter caeni]MBF5006374.1 hypothetical protein [Diaphorobacter caeni]